MASPSATTTASISEELARATMQADFKKFVDAKLEQRLSGLSREARLLLAVAPAWDAEFMERAGFLPTQSEGLLTELVRRGVLERVDEVSAHKLGITPLYSMKTQTRADVLDRAGEPSAFRRLLADIAGRLWRVTQLGDEPVAGRVSDDDRLAPFLRFVELLCRYSEVPADRRLTQRFDEHVKAALEPASAAVPLEDRVSEARRWIAAARPIADVLPRANDSSLELAIERAVCKIDLSRRDERDREHLGPRLEKFVRRAPPEAAFRALMGPDNAAWALHFIGGGGVGKTMLIRHICVELAKEFDAAVARIDFDYLNPDYPRFAPGLLLWAFAQELAAHDTTGRASARFAEAAGIFDQLHDELNQRPPGANERSSDHPKFRAGLRCYIDAIRDLRKNVLLIVDTCEELGKLRPDGRAPESVRETFAILEALQREVPSLRVIFSGRRPLASNGFGGWSTVQHELGERDYLRVHEVSGFTHAEAGEFLARRMGLAPELVDAIRHRTEEEATDSDIQWPEPAAPDPAERRCNPYELRLFGEWAREKPGPTPAEVLACDDDRYVEIRIISRIANERIRSLLPLLALMGQAEKNTLRAATGPEVGDDEFEALFRELCRQEWNTERSSPIPGGDGLWHFVQVRGSVRRRLVAWCGKHTDDRVAQRAADELQRQTLDSNLAELDWTTYDALFRLLATHPARAAEWWPRASERILHDRGDQWLLEVTRRLLGSDGVFGTDGGARDARPDAVRAEVLASHASALLHGDGTITELHDGWIELSVFAAEHADLFLSPARAAILRFRAAAGLTGLAEKFGESIATRAGEFTRATEALLEIQGGFLTADQIASAIAAIDAMIEHAEAHDEPQRTPTSGNLVRSLFQTSAPAEGSTPPDPVGEFFGRIEPSVARAVEDVAASDPANVLKATFDSLYARARFLERDYRRLPYCKENELPAGTERGRWSDWIPPEDPHSRLTLINAVTTYPRVQSHTLCSGWPGPTNEGVRTIDEDRCLSCRLRLSTADGMMSQEERHTLVTLVDLGRLGFSALSRFTTGERCHAHYSTLPYSVEAARTLARDGEPDRGRTLLQNLTSIPSFGATLRAHEALEEVTRRFRLRDTNPSSSHGGSRPHESTSFESLSALDGLDGPRRRSSLRSVVGADGPRSAWREFHAIWRGMYAGEDRAVDADQSSRRLIEILNWFEENFPKLANARSADPGEMGASGTDFDATMVRLDLEEALLLCPRLSRNREQFPLTDFEPASVDPLAWWNQNQDLPEHALRIFLRLGGLRPGSVRQVTAGDAPSVGVPPEIPKEIVRRLGRRRAAEVALDEGELLALRLPDRAAWILNNAAEWFRDAGDHAGRMMSLTLAMLCQHGPGAAPDQQRSVLLQCTSETPVFAFVKAEGRELSNAAIRRNGTGWSIPLELFTPDSLMFFRKHEKSAWYPWLARVLMALCPQSESALAALRTWLEESFGLRTRDGGVLLPAEMATWAARAQWTIDRAKAAEPPATTSSSPMPSAQQDATSFGLDAISMPTAPTQASPPTATSPGAGPVLSPLKSAANAIKQSAAKWAWVAAGLVIAIAIPVAVVRALWQAAANFAHGGSSTQGGYPALPMLGLIFLTLILWRTLRRSRHAWPWVVVIVLVAAFQLLSPTPSVRPFNWLAWTAWAAGTAMGLTAIYRLFAQQRAARIAGAGVRLRLTTERVRAEPGPVQESDPVRATLSWVGSAWRITPQSKPQLDLPEDIGFLLGAGEAYSKFVEHLDPRVSAALVQHAALIRPFAADTPIVCDQGGDGPCWEAIFQPTTNPGTLKLNTPEFWLESSPFRFRRETAYTKRHYFDTLGLVGHRAICWSDEHDSSANGLLSAWRAEWKRVAGTTAFLVLDDTSERARSVVKNVGANNANEEIRLLHLLGDTESTSAGVAWRIGGRVPDRFASNANASMNAIEAPRVAGLVRPGEVLRQFDTLRVCVLQSVDRAGPEQRRESDRIKAFQAREFAGELANAGVPLVLVLPPLDAALAAECVQLFVEAILKDPKGGAAFAEIAHRIRLLVLSRVPDMKENSILLDVAREAASELALDVCLFCAGDFNTSKEHPTTPEINADVNATNDRQN